MSDALAGARWRSESGAPRPERVEIADDRMTADAAFRAASAGTALLWHGDFVNARQLLSAMGRRVDRSRRRVPLASTVDEFRRHRQARSRRARILGMLLVPLDAEYAVPLRRAPEVRAACEEAYGESGGTSVVALTELLGVIGAHEWRRKGVDVPALGAKIHPHYGVFSPVRGEYVDLVARAPLPSTGLAFDIGTGSGVLAALLARRGVAKVVATDADDRALACARDNVERLGHKESVDVVRADLFPPGRAPLVVCNPPWVPAKPSSPLEHAVYDPGSRMLRGFLDGLPAHLTDDGEGWLVLSDFAEHLGLRTRDELLGWISGAGLSVLDRADIAPRHPKAADRDDPLHHARAAETTSLWRLGRADPAPRR